MPMLMCLWAKYCVDYMKVRDEVRHLIYGQVVQNMPKLIDDKTGDEYVRHSRWKWQILCQK
jgi:hypothetical protein